MRLHEDSPEIKAVIYPLPFLDHCWYHDKLGKEISVTLSGTPEEYFITQPPEYAGRHILIRDVKEM